MLILCNKPNSANLLILVADAGTSLYVRQRAFMIGLYMASFPADRRLVDRFLDAAADLLDDEWIKDVVATYREFGYFDIF